MADEEQAPRKTTTYKAFEGMNSQDARYGCEKSEFFFMENIMRTAPHKLSSVPGPAFEARFPGWLPPPWHIIPPGSCPACPCLTSDEADPNILIAHSAIATTPCSRFIQVETCDDVVQFSQATFENVVVGNPLSGPSARVLPGSTPTSFTGYGLIYDPGAATQKLSIVKWVAASLATMGTVLSSQNTTLVPGDVLKLNAQTVGGANQLIALINEGLQSSLTVTDSDIATTNLWAGFIVVGNTGADDRMEWDGLAASCESGGGGGGCTVPEFTFDTFTFGMNSFDSSAQPVDWVSGADWIIPTGLVTCGSCNNGIVSNVYRADIFDVCAPPAPLCIDADFFAAVSCVTAAIPLTAIMELQPQIAATFVIEVGSAISGIAFINSGSTVNNVIGVGLIIDGVDGTAKVVQWLGNSLDIFTIVHSETYTPSVGDVLKLFVAASPFPGTTYIVHGDITNVASESVFPLDAYVFLELSGADALALTDGAIVTIASGVDDSTITFSTVVDGILASSIC